MTIPINTELVDELHRLKVENAALKRRLDICKKEWAYFASSSIEEIDEILAQIVERPKGEVL